MASKQISLSIASPLTHRRDALVIKGDQGRTKVRWLVEATIFLVLLLQITKQPAHEYSIRFPKVLPGSSETNPPTFHYIHTTDAKSFHRRSLRSIESVFYHHPTSRVIVHIPHDGATTGLHSDLTNDPFLPLQKAGYNVTVRPFQLASLVEAALSQDGSIVSRRKAEKWMNTKIMKNFLGKNWYVDISDLARLLILYTEGGTYVDTDVIVVKPLTGLKNNVGFEAPGRPNNAALKFDRGNQFLGDCLNEYFSTYVSSTTTWGYVGPRLLKRVFMRKYESCQLPHRVEEKMLGKTDTNCPVTVLWQDAFYPDLSNCYVETEDVSIQRRLVVDEKKFL